ncbi:hypothetical protein C8Q70DRAFT_937906 [Cubamyces menziesii]|uniref:F-box domain-containing protein n=1 Tax=Trametes cubensis TaxID=1111947 RepID=A0AAD7TKL9_9APHY|nr:hypothetical protein C8Q70DRAFT_937906 [Cubamyces menziesii]KAJ8462708.1 hypothetical protein ONZ51_g10730 [Trametes cubensis]
MAVNLPKELVDYIIDLVHDSDATDWRTLTACALLHPCWAKRSLAHLSSPAGITLKVDWPDCPDFTDLASILQSQSARRLDAKTAILANDIGAAIHQLTISGPVSSTTHTADGLLPLSEPIPLERLSNLRVLTLRQVMIPDIPSFAALLTQCTTIEEMSLQGLALEVTATTTSKTALDAACKGLRGHPVLPRLQKLQLLDIVDPFSQLISTALADIIYYAAPATPIRTLGLHPTSLCPTGNCNLLGWYEAITHISNTLARLSVTVVMALVRFIEYSDGSRFPTAIYRCEHLRHFALCYHPGPYLRSTHWDQPEFFLSSVHGMFSYSPPRFARVLESFVLAMPYEQPPYTPDSIVGQLTQLVQTLLNTENYPALSSFHFCIILISTLATDPTVRGDPLPLSGTQEVGTWVESIAAVLEPLRGRDVEVETRAMRMDEWSARY